MVKFGRVVFELREQTDRQTKKQIYSSQYFALLSGRGEVITFTDTEQLLHE